MAPILTPNPIISDGMPGVMNLNANHEIKPRTMALKAAGVFALGHQIPAVRGTKSPTRRILKESSSSEYTSPTNKATSIEKMAKRGTDNLVHLKTFSSEAVLIA